MVQSPHPIRFPPELPIVTKRAEIQEHLRTSQVLVVAGETGSGKSTQLPLICREAFGHVRIAVTQPRRIAATSLARRVAQQLVTPLGDQVGYRIRFDERVQPDTPILFMTDGILLREIQTDKFLKRYGVIIVDEAHERSLNIDFLLGYLRQILPSRPDLRVIISSATIDTDLFSTAFGNAPVIEVSGRMFPVETIYLPPEQESDELDGYVEAAVDAALQLAEDPEPGGILVFMPTERDINETVALLRERADDYCTVLPLFSRLSASDQDKIFGATQKRKIVVATNIAETSITVPDIRSVVDTGLARMHRYLPNLQTSKLPVEKISQASANQRKGRCGRVADGLCVRLYSEEDFQQRDQFTTPEILRSNLAGVVLSMQSLGLGDVYAFPFLQPPDSRAIKEGYRQLRYLGAIDDQNRLTAIGRKMARLPLDPHVSRMVLAGAKEGVLHDIMIIASGISVVDPRRQPENKRELARIRHQQFSDPRSDFMTFLNLWTTYHETWQSLRTQSAIRRFCRENFLSYQRMQEWHDIYRQIQRTQRIARTAAHNTLNDSDRYERIHRAVLAGLITNACVKQDDGSYRASRGRTVWIHPGSVLFKTRPEWIVCQEVIETTRAFGRTAASIDPSWIEALAPHLCKSTFHSPAFDPETGFVSAFQNITFFGLPLFDNRKIDYSRVNRSHASEIFIREGLVEENLRSEHRFYRQNKELRKRARLTESKLRERGIVADDEHLVALYAERLEQVAGLPELNRLIRRKKNDGFLRFTEEDFLVSPPPDAVTDYPDKLQIGDARLPLAYSFAPGEKHDGLTVELPHDAAGYIEPEAFGWLVPPLWEEKIQHLLSTLPKSQRKRFVPLKKTAREIASSISREPLAFTEVLSRKIHELYGIEIAPEAFDERSLPAHLRMRIRLVGSDQKEICTTRDTDEIRQKAPGTIHRDAWHSQFAHIEREGITAWDFDELPTEVTSHPSADSIPLTGFPALIPHQDSVRLIVVARQDEATRLHCTGVRKLLELGLAQDISWEEKDCRLTKAHRLFLTPFSDATTVGQHLLSAIKRHALTVPPPAPRTREEFRTRWETARATLRGTGHLTLEKLDKTHEAFVSCHHLLKTRAARQTTPLFRGLDQELMTDLKGYLHHLCAPTVSFDYVVNLPRYLSAFYYRIEKAYDNRAQYRSRMAELRDYTQKLEQMRSKQNAEELEPLWSELEDMIEEYAVSLFAPQHIRPRYPVSPKRLDKAFKKVSA